jgi:Flp pilus assembly protein protease CpaA
VTIATATSQSSSTVLRWAGMGAVVILAIGGWTGVPIALAVPGLLLAARTDARSHVIPNRLLAAAVALFVPSALFVGGTDALPALAAGGATFAAMFVTLLADPRLGGGDVKLAPLVGALAAWPWAADGTDLLTCVLIGLASLVLGLTSALAAHQSTGALPLAPAMAVGALVVALAGLLC